MDININNYSLSCLSDTKLELNDSIPFVHKCGCNGFVKSSRKKYIYLVIPKQKIDEVLKFIFKKNSINYTFENIVDVFKEMTFKYNYAFIDKEVTFQDQVVYKGYYIFEIENTDNHAHKYYAFCMIRHFYYAQDMLTMYMNIYHKLDGDFEKIIALSIFTMKQNQYSFISSRIPLESDLTFSKILEDFNIKNTNSLSNGVIAGSTAIQRTESYYDISAVLERIKVVKKVIHNYSDDAMFDNDPYFDIFKNYIEKGSNLKYNLNINPKYINNVVMTTYGSIVVDDVTVISPNLCTPDQLIIPAIPSVLNITKNILPKRHRILEPITPKVIININKTSKKVYDCIVLNASNVINKLKNRKNINLLSDQVEPSTFPCKITKKLRTKNDITVIVKNNKDLQKWNLKQFIIQPLLNNSNTHYLFFTKNELFLHQVDIKTCIIDNNSTEISKYMLQNSDEMIEKCTKVFNNSGLDIGCMIVDVSTKDNLYFIKDITPYQHNGDFSRNIYLKQLNKVICAV